MARLVGACPVGAVHPPAGVAVSPAVVHGEVDPGDVGRRLQGFAAQLLDLRPFWPTAARLGREWLKEQFATEGAFGGDPWAPLAASTVAQRGSAHPILDDTGALKGAASRPVRHATPLTLELEVVDPKIHFHQHGTRKMPRRPVVPDVIPGHALAELQREFDQYVDGVIERWGLK